MGYTVRNGKVVRTHRSATTKAHQISKRSYPSVNPHKAIDPKTGYPKDKGEWNGSCNRRCCLSPNAVYYNRGSYAFYCVKCAILLNSDNYKEALELPPGGPLCYLVHSKKEASELHVR